MYWLYTDLPDRRVDIVRPRPVRSEFVTIATSPTGTRCITVIFYKEYESNPRLNRLKQSVDFQLDIWIPYQILYGGHISEYVYPGYNNTPDIYLSTSGGIYG